MKVLLFTFGWVVFACAVVAVAFYQTRRAPDRRAIVAPLSLGSKLLVGLLALAALVGAPVLVASATSDRVPSGAGTYSLDSSAKQREGRTIFRETCASCHTLSAAGARGVYGPNLDTIGISPEGGAERVAKAIEKGGASGMQMPAELLTGENAELVSEYVADVAGK